MTINATTNDHNHVALDICQDVHRTTGRIDILGKRTLGFKTIRTAYATIKGFEVMRALKKGQARLWQYQEASWGKSA